MAIAKNSKTPETFSNSVLAYTLAVQHGTGKFSTLQTNPTTGTVAGATDALEDFEVLARFTNITPTQARTITRVYEINNFVGGRAVELIPGGISDDSISMARIETYQQTILEALDPLSTAIVDENGQVDTQQQLVRGGVDNLIFQRRPIYLLRYIIWPKAIVFGDANARLDVYCYCFVSHIDKTIDVSGGGGGLVTANCTLAVTKRRSRYIQLADSQALQSSLLSGIPETQGQPTSKTGFPAYTVTADSSSYGQKLGAGVLGTQVAPTQ